MRAVRDGATRAVPTTERDFPSAARHLRERIATRKLVKAELSEEPVRTAFDTVGITASDGSKVQRLEAVSLLGKAFEISKPVSEIVQPLLVAALTKPLPPVGIWGSAEDRYYLAVGLSRCDEGWVAEYAATELATGDIAERSSRRVWSEISVERTANLSDLLKLIASALSNEKRMQQYPTDTASRKLIRILDALRDPLSLADVPVGDGFGKALSDLVYGSASRHGPTSQKLRCETAEEILGFMVQVLRLKSSIVLDAKIYRAAKTAIDWWKPGDPPESVTAPVRRLIAMAIDQVHMLARRGYAEKPLRDAIVSAFGARWVNNRARAVAKSDPALSPAMAAWLATGTEADDITSNPAVRDASDQALDQLLARLLLTIEDAGSSPDLLELAAAELDFLEPRHALLLRASAGQLKLSRQWMHAIAEARGLAFSGRPGEIVQFDPDVHECDPAPSVAAPVRLRTPAVLKHLGRRASNIVLKAGVEAV